MFSEPARRLAKEYKYYLPKDVTGPNQTRIRHQMSEEEYEDYLNSVEDIYVSTSVEVDY